MTNKIQAVLNGKHKADFTLQIIKNKNGEKSGILCVPFVDWIDDKTDFISNRVLNIKGRELECIKKNYFDKNHVTLPVQGYPYPIEMCDIVFKVIPPGIYNQLLSSTFKIDKNADPEFFASFFNEEKLNTQSVNKFIEQKSRLNQNFDIDNIHILYAKEIKNTPEDSPPFFVTMKKIPSLKLPFIVQIHNMEKGTLNNYSTNDVYIAKKLFDNINTYSEYKKLKHNFNENTQVETKKRSNNHGR